MTVLKSELNGLHEKGVMEAEKFKNVGGWSNAEHPVGVVTLPISILSLLLQQGGVSVPPLWQISYCSRDEGKGRGKNSSTKLPPSVLTVPGIPRPRTPPKRAKRVLKY